MKGFIKFTRGATVGGTAYQPGTIAEFDADVVRELLSKGLAVPSAGPGRRTLTVDAVGVVIKPVVRAAQ